MKIDIVHQNLAAYNYSNGKKEHCNPNFGKNYLQHVCKKLEEPATPAWMLKVITGGMITIAAILAITIPLARKSIAEAKQEKLNYMEYIKSENLEKYVELLENDYNKASSVNWAEEANLIRNSSQN